MSQVFENIDAVLVPAKPRGRTARGAYTDLRNTVFGYWSVISFAGTLNGKPFWNCLCTCGTMKPVMAQSLRSGKSTNCGCKQRELARKPKKLTENMRFGRLVSLSLLAGSGGIWLCRCDCGNEITVRSSSLLNGHTASCGCFGEEQRRAATTTHGLSHTREYIAMKARQRLERKRKLDVEWTLAMEQLLREIQPVCVVCTSDLRLSVDHVLPLSKGHGLRPGNAVILCVRCNTAKRDRPLEALAPAIAEKILTAAAAFAAVWETNRSLL